MLLAGCGSSKIVNYPVENSRIMAYYAGKANGDPFQSAFYEHVDSVKYDSTDRKWSNIRANVDGERSPDSLGWHSQKYYGVFLQILTEQLKEK